MKEFSKINNTDLNTGVASLPLRPNQTTQFGQPPLSGKQLQERFDHLAKDIIAAKFNELIDILSSTSVLSYFKITDKETLAAFVETLKDNLIDGQLSASDPEGEGKKTVDAILSTLYSAIEAVKAFVDYQEGEQTIANIYATKNELTATEGKIASETTARQEAVSGLQADLETKISTAKEDAITTAGTNADTKISTHNTNTGAHNDIRLKLQSLANRINEALDSDDTTLDALSEIVAYIKSNKSLIDAVTASKVNVADIINNLITDVADMPLSAAQGVELKGFIDALRNDKLDASALTTAINNALAQAKESGAFDGEDGVGILSIEKTGSSGLVDTYTITLTKGTPKTFTVTNGQNGVTPTVEINASGYWVINGVATNVKAKPDFTEAHKNEIVVAVLEAIGTPIYGILDENNHFTLKGDLADGTYTFGYDMKDGSSVPIGELVLDTAIYYTISNDLTNCANGNSSIKVVEGKSYSATISANSGYALSSIKVTMGGVDITASAVSGGNISIVNVTGNIVITAVAEETTVKIINWLEEVGYEVGKRISLSSGEVKDASTRSLTGFIPCKYGQTVRLEKIDVTKNDTITITAFDINKNPLKGASSLYGQSLYIVFVQKGTESNGVYASIMNKSTDPCFPENMEYIRITTSSFTDESIITVDQEIHEEAEFDNGLFNPSMAKLNYRLSSQNVETQQDGVFYTQDYIPVTPANEYLCIKGCTVADATVSPHSLCGVWYYDSNKTFLGKEEAMIIEAARKNMEIVDATNLIYKSYLGVNYNKQPFDYASQIAFVRLVLSTNAQADKTKITSSDIEKIVIKIDEIIT